MTRSQDDRISHQFWMLGRLRRGVRVLQAQAELDGIQWRLAQAFPACRYFGYDVYGPAVEEATTRAKAADVQDRVTFQQVDVSKGLRASMT